MSTTDLETTLHVARSIATEAGHLSLASFRKEGQKVSHKSVVDLVTQTDYACEELIGKRISSHFPKHAILAEEGGASGQNEATHRWHVDPLDGTINFAHGHPYYCISIGLESQGELLLGVVHAPALGVTWTAIRGQGAERNGQKISVSNTAELSQGLVASGFPHDRWENPDNNTKEWALMVTKAQGVRRCGSAAIDLCSVADGTYVGFWEKRLNPWDLAAGTLIVEQAGGRVTNLEGARVPPWPQTIVATNTLVHSQLQTLLRSVSA